MTTRSEFPYMARVEITSIGENGAVFYYCSGSLIAPRFVLTAAQCIISGYKT